jgi:hypothetical protein
LLDANVNRRVLLSLVFIERYQNSAHSSPGNLSEIVVVEPQAP